MSSPDPTVHILLATFEGERWLPEWLASLRAQEHRHWRLWVKDDGSSDGTVQLLQSAAATDARITLCSEAPTGSGAARSFAWLWNQLASEADYVAFADQDDVWLPNRLSLTLTECRRIEGPTRAEPALVHTDLEVVDESLRPIAPSFTRYALLPRGTRTLRDVIRGNAAVGCTMTLNRALRAAVGPLPDELPMHDWWIACAAAAFGSTRYLDTPTVRYRQHGGNVVGVRRRAHGPLGLLWAMHAAFGRTEELRHDLAEAAAQAAAFVRQYGPRLTSEDRRFAAEVAAIPTLPWGARQLALMRRYWSGERSLLRNLGLILRG